MSNFGFISKRKVAMEIDDNTIYGDSSYLHQRSLWDDHQDYKPIRIYRPSLPY